MSTSKRLRLALLSGAVTAGLLVPIGAAPARASTASDTARVLVGMASALRPCLAVSGRIVSAYNTLRSNSGTSPAIAAAMTQAHTVCYNTQRALTVLGKKIPSAAMVNYRGVLTFDLDEAFLAFDYSIASTYLHYLAGGGTALGSRTTMLKQIKLSLDGSVREMKERNKTIPILASELHISPGSLM